MHILVTGGTGFIGSLLVTELLEASHSVTVLTRSARHSEREHLSYLCDLEQLESPVEAVVNLAGASLADKRWSASYKQTIRDSRLETTRELGDRLRAAGITPVVWLNASAIGFYGARGDEIIDERSSRGAGFAAELCSDWEQLAQETTAEQTRLCILRLGVVLDRGGGAYVQMAQPFRMGIGNWIGPGSQWLSWIHRADVVAAMLFLLGHVDAAGVFNLTAPQPVTSRGFCAAMKKQHRTLVTLPMPAPVMRVLVGEMADELLLSGQRVLPRRLEQLGFEFAYPDIDAALADIESE